MKFTCQVEIDLPRNEVVKLFDDPNNLKEWQDGYVSSEHVSGSPRKVGAKTKFTYKAGSKTIELIETIKTNDLPEEFVGLYQAKEMENTMRSTFTTVNERRTRWKADLEYTEFHGLIPKLMATVMPGTFRKQTQKWLDQFKVFAESNSN